MFNLAAFILLATISSTYAAEEFGGIKFHSTVEKSHLESFKKDLAYLYKSTAPNPDEEFLNMAQLQRGDGPRLHNWLLNRVRYVYGEKFAFDIKDTIIELGNYPKTPLPELPEMPENSSNQESFDMKPTVVMTNSGSRYYLEGKMRLVYFGFKFDEENVIIKSPRTGVVQIGKGLFSKPDSDSITASISRLRVLFHEARHSDGNGKSAMFLHTYCPVGHWFEGSAACDNSLNGPYTIEALSLRHMILNCSTCSSLDKTKLSSGVFDAFSRVVALPSKKAQEYLHMASIYSRTKSTYEQLMKETKDSETKAAFKAEIKELDLLVSSLKLKAAKEKSKKPKFLDPKPEGDWTPMSLKTSKKSMERSLKLFPEFK